MTIVINLDRDFSPLSNNLHTDRININLAKQNLFGAGEVNIQLPQRQTYNPVDRVILTHRLISSDRIMEVLLVLDAVRREYHEAKIDLFIPYIPYARQDRVMNHGESLSIKVFANLINNCKFNRVFVMTPHSDVSVSLIENCYVVDEQNFISRAVNYATEGREYIIVSPDAGALKRTYKAAFHLNYRGRVGVASKYRNTSDNSISGTTIDIDDFGGKDVIIIDDICSGGRTFLELAKELRNRNVGQIFLIVTHFENNQYVNQLDGYIDRVLFTDSFTTVDDTQLFKQFPISLQSL